MNRPTYPSLDLISTHSTDPNMGKRSKYYSSYNTVFSCVISDKQGGWIKKIQCAEGHLSSYMLCLSGALFDKTNQQAKEPSTAYHTVLGQRYLNLLITSIHTYISFTHIHTRARARARTHAHTHTQTETYIHTYMYICIYAYIYEGHTCFTTWTN